MGFELKLSEDKTFVIFTPNEIAKAADEFVLRRVAIGDFAERHGINKILLDYRDKKLSLDPRFYESVTGDPRLNSENRWKFAVVVSMDARPHSNFVAQGLVDLLSARRQKSGMFFDYDDAVTWLGNAKADPG